MFIRCKVAASRICEGHFVLCREPDIQVLEIVELRAAN